MARHRRTLEDMLADAAGQHRANAGIAYSTPAMTPIGSELIQENAVGNEQIADEVLVTIGQTIDTKIVAAIDESLALPMTDERFTENSLTIWPFIDGAVGRGAFAPGAVQGTDIADFAIAVKKLKSDRHQIY